MLDFSPPDYIRRARKILEQVFEGLQAEHEAIFALMHLDSTQQTLVSMRRLLDCCTLEPEVVDHLIKCLAEMLRYAERVDEEDFLDIVLAANLYIQKVAALYNTDF
jgi:hypothetical protein